MKIAVTGGSGFIGSHIVDILCENGHEVLVIDKGVKPYRDDVEFFDVDITDYNGLEDVIKNCEQVFHLAAISNVNHVYDNPRLSVDINISGTVNILEASRNHGISRVYFASTVWVYTGCNGQNVDEDSPFYLPGAGHIYSTSKIASEFLIHDYWELYKQPFTILRYGIPYGPRMRKELVIPIFINKALNGEDITISGDGSQFRNFVYVGDIAKAHILAMNEKAKNQVINLEGRQKVTVKNVAETIVKEVGSNSKITFGESRPGDYEGKEVSAEKAVRLLKWKSTTGFTEGIEKTVKWYRENVYRKPVI